MAVPALVVSALIRVARIGLSKRRARKQAERVGRLLGEGGSVKFLKALWTSADGKKTALAVAAGILVIALEKNGIDVPAVGLDGPSGASWAALIALCIRDALRKVA